MDRSRRKKASLIRSLVVTSATTAIIATGSFGALPKNDLTAAFQKVIVEYVPVEITHFIEPYLYREPEPAQNAPDPEIDFPLAIPLTPPARMTIDPVDRFSEAQSNVLIQYGVDFVNSQGTPVLAAAEGTVRYAGLDQEGVFSPFPEFHGQMVVLEHHLPGFSEPVFTIYSHLSEINIEAGQPVLRGEVIGAVGSTGQTTGSELHFEVRYGENHTHNARNPELWLLQSNPDGEPLHGALAGRVLNVNGAPITGLEKVVVTPLGEAGGAPIDVLVYSDNRLQLQLPWYETFAIGNLPPGAYKISFSLPGVGFQSSVVDIYPGRITQWEWVKPEE